jgi:hypothetical protein
MSTTTKAIFPLNIQMKAETCDSVFKAPNVIASSYGVKGMCCFKLDLPLKGIADSLVESWDSLPPKRCS